MTDLDARVTFQRKGFALDIDLRIPADGITALLGPSGGGKTTLLRLLAGLERPSSGTIRHGDQIWLDRARRIDLAPRHRRVGFMFQDYALFPHLSVARNIAFGLPRGADRSEQIAPWLERLGLRHLADRPPAALSGGQRQRVALARALAARPRVLLLDEPFSAVDFSLRQALRILFQEVVADAGIPAILVSHDLEDVRQVADRVGVIIDGRLRRLGPTEEVFARPGDAEVARVLGWPNTLAVQHWEGETACGTWGRVPIRTDTRTRHPEVVAILPDGPTLSMDKGLPIEVSRITDMGGYHALLCRLADRSPLRIHLPKTSPAPSPGTSARLEIPSHCVVPLRERASAPECGVPEFQ
ncbi:ABC transporter ATP-binding protein [Thiocystis violacea]|uniref:ABC transporter ATP-binding protein n=1 Tax=Thiocystis violacea TaxID=13725 RepID=UPI0019083CAB|nr:ABC transporter ATP-binding protein [Thiocystis violacea]MBK1722028.1 ABC transporter [Thiocystis violacea]